MLGRGRAAETVADRKGGYVLVSLRQLDLYPQISQVESIAVRGACRKEFCGSNFIAPQAAVLTVLAQFPVSEISTAMVPVFIPRNSCSNDICAQKTDSATASDVCAIMMTRIYSTNTTPPFRR